MEIARLYDKSKSSICEAMKKQRRSFVLVYLLDRKLQTFMQYLMMKC